MMRRTINLLLMLLFVAEVTSANTVDFDKAFKESARIEKQIKRTSFPKRTFHWLFPVIALQSGLLYV